MKVRHWLLSFVIALFAIALCATGAWAQDMVVHHIDDMSTQALEGLRNIRNHLGWKA